MHLQYALFNRNGIFMFLYNEYYIATCLEYFCIMVLFFNKEELLPNSSLSLSDAVGVPAGFSPTTLNLMGIQILGKAPTLLILLTTSQSDERLNRSTVKTPQ